jgi:hypothetical protein
LDDNTIDFIGHAVALHRDDSYLSEPAIDTVKRMKESVISEDKYIPSLLCFFQKRLVFNHIIQVSPTQDFLLLEHY